jgi:hypothetical protein
MKRLRVALILVIPLIASLLIPHTASAQSSPATPIQESPANGATDLPPQVTVRWTLSNPGETYRIQISLNSTFTSLITDAQVVDATGWTVFGLAKDTVHYWRVNASADGETSAWSPVWSFRVTNRDIAPVPVLVSPASGTTGLTESPPLVWGASAGADSYDIQIALSSSFLGSTKTAYAWVGTSKTFGNLDDYSKHFYWRVRARNVAGLSAWSAPWDFTCVSFGCE